MANKEKSENKDPALANKENKDPDLAKKENKENNKIWIRPWQMRKIEEMKIQPWQIRKNKGK